MVKLKNTKKYLLKERQKQRFLDDVIEQIQQRQNEEKLLEEQRLLNGSPNGSRSINSFIS